LTLRIERRDDLSSTLSLRVDKNRKAWGTFDFRVATDSLKRLGLGLAASVDRKVYLDSWSPEGTWPTASLELLQMLAREV
jgi:hypothetical protein